MISGLEGAEMKDHVDFVVAQWAESMPEVNASSMEVFGRIARLQKHLERMRAEALMSFGFKEGEFDVLATLRRSGHPYRLSPTQLYRHLLITSGAMTNRLARLESAGLVERIADTLDRRSSHVGLTPVGIAQIDLAIKVHTRTQERILDALTAEQQAELAALMKTVLVSLPGEQAPTD